MCPQCGAKLEGIPSDAPGCYEVYSTECAYSAHIITSEGLGDDPEQEGEAGND